MAEAKADEKEPSEPYICNDGCHEWHRYDNEHEETYTGRKFIHTDDNIEDDIFMTIKPKEQAEDVKYKYLVEN